MKKSQFNLKEIKEMSDEEFNNFIKFHEDIVLNKLGWSPIDECLIGMWEIWKYCHKSIDEKKLNKLANSIEIINKLPIPYDDCTKECIECFKIGYRSAFNNKEKE